MKNKKYMLINGILLVAVVVLLAINVVEVSASQNDGTYTSGFSGPGTAGQAFFAGNSFAGYGGATTSSQNFNPSFDRIYTSSQQSQYWPPKNPKTPSLGASTHLLVFISGKNRDESS